MTKKNVKTWIVIGGKKISAWLCVRCPGSPKITNIEQHNAALHALDSPGRTEECISCGKIFLAVIEYTTHKCADCKRPQQTRAAKKSGGVPRKKTMSSTGVEFYENIKQGR